jgi:hypothetical protein
VADEADGDAQLRALMEELLAPAKEAKQQAIATHEALRSSTAFQNGMAYNRRVCTDFIKLLRLVSVMATRDRSLSEHTLSIRMTDYFLQSTIVIAYLIENGFHGPAKRELRFVLEAGVRFLATDQALSGASIGEKNAHLAMLPDRFREIVDGLGLPGLDESDQVAMRGRILDLYGSLSTIVHASQAQVSIDLKRWERGAPIGFEAVSHVKTMNDLCIGVFDLGSVLSLHAIGLGIAEDIFAAALDDEPKWVFHKTQFTELLAAHFDYKVERQPGGPP